LGINYPKPIINMERTRKFASDFLWEMRKNPLVKEESFRILKLHTMSGANDNES
jgi:deoxyribodipyrimidine photo-lyase